MIQYKILAYDIVSSGKRDLVLTRKGVFDISDHLMLQVLKNLKQGDISETDLFELIDEQKLDRKSVVEYLAEELGVLLKPFDDSFEISNIVVVSDCSVVKQCLAIKFNKLSFVSVQYHDLNSLQVEKSYDADFVLVIITDYKDHLVREVYKKFGEKTFFLVSYLLGQRLFINNLYSHDSGQPCHYCVLGEAVGNYANELTHIHDSFFQVYQYIFNNNLPFDMSYQYDDVDYYYIVRVVFTHVYPFLNNPIVPRFDTEKLGLYTIIDLDDGSSNSDVPLHWEYCNCIAGGHHR